MRAILLSAAIWLLFFITMVMSKHTFAMFERVFECTMHAHCTQGGCISAAIRYVLLHIAPMRFARPHLRILSIGGVTIMFAHIKQSRVHYGTVSYR